MLRAATALAVSLVLLAGAAVLPAGAQTDLERARRTADAVAAEVADAQTRLAEVEAEAEEVAAEVERTRAALVALEAVVQDQAVERFIHGGSSATGTAALLLTGEEISTATRADALARSVTTDATEVLEDYRLATEDLAASEERLGQLRAEQADALAALEARAEEATAELERQVRLEAEARAAAERAAAEAAAAARAAAPTSRAPSSDGSGPAPSAATAPQVLTTGGGAFLCPVAGSRAFTNDWGMARSGGRRHQGTDILSPRGTPVVANVSGSVRGHQSSLGGVSYYLEGDDGHTYFGTHLDSLSGASGRVAQGTVLGYVGNSGNARGGPTHLHFEIHPGGGSPTNPYPTLASSC